MSLSYVKGQKFEWRSQFLSFLGFRDHVTMTMAHVANPTLPTTIGDKHAFTAKQLPLSNY